ncbi:MAG: chorismate synthase [Deltaproteobacteria bacterium]|nr:chorismate synthase [Deltaproteobacteria bacterium]
MALRYRTAGESHGPLLAALVEGLPAGLEVEAERIDRELARRQRGYGRGGRMAIEADRVEILSGVRWGRTTGAPVLLAVRNRDWENWRRGLSPEPADRGAIEAVRRVRPGHADLPGVLKYDLDDARDVLERASARETAARVAAGALARHLLGELGVGLGSFVDGVGDVVWDGADGTWDLPALHEQAEQGALRFPDPTVDARGRAAVDEARGQGDTLGGTFVCFATGLPVGLGTHAAWDKRLDGRIGRAFLSIPAIKGVEVGFGFRAARLPGSRAHDEILPGGPGDGRRGGVHRETNRAGGLEGGMTNGEDLWVRAAMKPIPTLMRPLRTVDLSTGEPTSASTERSDVCAVPAASVVGEAALALEAAGALVEKFGGDNLADLRAGFEAYLDRLDRRWTRP